MANEETSVRLRHHLTFRPPRSSGRKVTQAQFENRGHFFGAAAEAMRRILIERARRKMAVRHGGGQERVNVDDVAIAAPNLKDEELLALDEALDRLAGHDSRKAELVKLRYFTGLKIEEVAEVLGVSTPTVKRDWVYARAWLLRKMSRDGAAS